MKDLDGKYPGTPIRPNDKPCEMEQHYNRILQHELMRRGFRLKYGADGYYTKEGETADAVKGFCGRIGRPESLVIGKTFWDVLVNERAVPKVWQKRKLALEAARNEKLTLVRPSVWGSVGQASGYQGVETSFAGKPLIPHYGAIGNRLGPITMRAELEMLRSWDRFHRYGQGWDGGLGYHIVVCKSGRAYASERLMNSQNAAATGNAKGGSANGYLPNSCLNINLMLGDKEKPTKAMLETVRKIQAHYKTRGVRYHYEFDWTSCPGKVIPKYVN